MQEQARAGVGPQRSTEEARVGVRMRREAARRESVRAMMVREREGSREATRKKSRSGLLSTASEIPAATRPRPP